MTWQRWVRTVEIEPRLNAGEPGLAERQVEALLRTGCRLFHLDLADADGLALGTQTAALVEAALPLVRRHDGILDVHLQPADPADHLAAVAAAGAASVTLPYPQPGLVLAAASAHG